MNMSTFKSADRIGSLKPYSPPARDARITLMLDNNEGAPVDQSVLDSIRSISVDDMSRYPDASCLERSIADRFGVNASRVIVTNGGDDAIDRVCRAILNVDDSLLTHTPGFVMIPRWAQLAGAQTKLIDWLDGQFPLNDMLDSIDETTRLIALVSPCNPTGSVIDSQSIIEIASKAQMVGAVVLLDQAYIEFAEDDPIEQVIGLPNVIVVRTFSKAMGLAGLRIGYAIGPQRLIKWLRTVGGPYPVSVPSQVIASAALANCDDRSEIIARTTEHRALLIHTLKSMGILALESQGNFVLARFGDARGAHESLLNHGVSVRRFRQGGDIESYLRITVPADPSQLNQLIVALNTLGEYS
tara:strand:+ start:77243 stop:78310 length:1068 start_codon:yes stop_codon:yes gene_type:complete